MGLAWAELQGVELPRDKDGAIDTEGLRQLIPRWAPHNLRHRIATHLRERLRVGRDVVALILGHQQRGGTQATTV